MRRFFGPLIRRWLTRLRRRRPRRPAPPPPPDPKPEQSGRLPPGPRVFDVGCGWWIEQHPVTQVTPYLPGSWTDPRGRLLVAPGRRHAWVWPLRLTHLCHVSPGDN